MCTALLSFRPGRKAQKKSKAEKRKGKLAGLIEVNKLLLFWLGAKKEKGGVHRRRIKNNLTSEASSERGGKKMREGGGL